MKQIIYSIFLLLFLAACSSEIPPQGITDKEKAPLVIPSIGIGSDVSIPAATLPLVEGTLGIFQTSGSPYAPAPYYYIGVGGNWTSRAPLTLGPEDASVCAWFPGNYFAPSSIADLARFHLETQIYSAENDLAFFPVTGGINSGHSGLNIRLTHAYALISFNLHRDVSYKGDGVVTSITFNNEHFVRAERMDIRNGNFSDKEIVRSLSLDVSATIAGSVTTTINVLVPPFTFPDTRLSLQVDGKTLSGTFPGTSVGTLHSGMSRTFDVTLRRNLELSVSVLPVDGSAEGEITW